MLQTMMWPDEVRVPDFKVEVDDAKPQEVKMAHMLVETLAGDFDASEFEDDYAGAVEALVKSKIEGGEIKRTETSTKTSGEVVDLLAALQKSVAAAKTARGEADADDDSDDEADDEKPAKKTRRPKKAAARRRRRRPPRPRRPPAAKKASWPGRAVRDPPSSRTRRAAGDDAASRSKKGPTLLTQPAAAGVAPASVVTPDARTSSRTRGRSVHAR